MSTLKQLLNAHFNFTLDFSGVINLFGGEESFGATKSVHLIPSRRFLGWYNSPGSYFTAKKYGILTNSLLWRIPIGGPTIQPGDLLQMDNKGPELRYVGLYSGTRCNPPGHFSRLISRYCDKAPFDNLLDDGEPNKGGPSVTLLRFGDTAPLADWAEDTQVPSSSFPTISVSGKVAACFTILVSVLLCILSALIGDWFAFAVMLLGLLVNGVSLVILGKGILRVKLSQADLSSPPGDGVLFDDNSIILLMGPERVISTILRSEYRLEFDSDPQHHQIGLCSISLLLQSILQILLVPQAQLIGQSFFLITLAVSWIYNGYLASQDQQDIQTNILFSIIGEPVKHKVHTDKWAKAVAFTMFSLASAKPPDSTYAFSEDIIHELVPNNTPTWNIWKTCISQAIREGKRPLDILINAHSLTKYSVPQDEVFATRLVQSADQVYDKMDVIRSSFTVPPTILRSVTGV